MKKFLAVMFTICLFANTAFASAQYDAAIAKLKSEKSAKKGDFGGYRRWSSDVISAVPMTVVMPSVCSRTLR